MSLVLKWFYLLALIVWVGEVVFFSFVVAPSLFQTFSAGDAGRAVGAIFPNYYRIGYVCGAVLLIAGTALLGAAGSRLWWSVNSLLVAVMLGATLYAGLVIQPRAAALRPQIHEASAPQTIKDEFSRLHRLAVMLNGVVLLGGLVVSVTTAAALQP
jgi:uncharacterized membrane protein